MSNTRLLNKLLHLKELKIKWFVFKDHGKQLHLGVKPYKNGCRCPECGQRGWIVRPATDERTWTDIAVFGLQVILHYAPKEITCRTPGRLQEEIPWAAVSSGVVNSHEIFVAGLPEIFERGRFSEILKMP